MVVSVPISIAMMAPAAVVFDNELIAYVFGLALFVAVGIGVALRLRSSAKSLRAREDVAHPEHSLEHYQALFEEGLIDAQEFERIVALLAKHPPTPPAKP